MQDPNAMETTHKPSRKRKQPPPSTRQNSPFDGILTRHKTQKYFFNRNRSGKSRKCRSLPLPPATNIRPKNGDGGYEDICCGSIKDLRARRVFSKPPLSKAVVSGESYGFGVVGEKPSLLVGEKCGSVINGGSFDLSVSSEKCDSVINGGKPNELVSEKCGSVVNGEKPNEVVSEECGTVYNGGNTDLLVLKICDDIRVEFVSNGGSPDSSEKRDSRVDCGAVSDEMSPNLSKKDVSEDYVQTTPPEAVILVRGGDDQNVVQNGGSVSGSSTREVTPRKDGSAEGRKSISNSKKNLALTPCSRASRMKLFKTPNSFSYRRLLPYLMDIAKEESCAAKVSPTMKTEINVDEKPLVSSSQESVENGPTLDRTPLNTVTNSGPQKVSIHRKELSPDPNTSDPITLPEASSPSTKQTAVPNAINHSSQQPALPKASDPGTQQAPVPKASNQKAGLLRAGDPSSQQAAVATTSDPRSQQAAIQSTVDCPVDKSRSILACSESQVGAPVIIYDSVKGASHDNQASSGHLVKMGDLSSIIEHNLASMSHSPKESPEATAAESILSTSPEEENRPAHVKFETDKNSICLFHSSSNPEAVVSPGAPVVSLAKGILKRNPRGCRGICHCLNCASLRLNAEKAFEFSRNQLLDAEEVAVDLMKELASLRRMLNKSITGATDVALVPISQVEEACRRASNAEYIARSRLRQMNEDLYVHSRTKALRRPRVSFSNNVQANMTIEFTKKNDQNAM